jgi:hypothetical protein
MPEPFLGGDLWFRGFREVGTYIGEDVWFRGLGRLELD